MKTNKIIRSALVTATVLTIGTQFCRAGFLDDVAGGVVDVITAPAKAVVEVGKDVSEGKLPSLDKAGQALNPTYAQIVATDKATGVSKTMRTTAQLPGKASGAIDDGKKVMANADGAITEGRSAIAAIQLELHTFLSRLSPPLQFVLWGLAALIGLKIFRGMKPKPVK